MDISITEYFFKVHQPHGSFGIADLFLNLHEPDGKSEYRIKCSIFISIGFAIIAPSEYAMMKDRRSPPFRGVLAC